MNAPLPATSHTATRAHFQFLASVLPLERRTAEGPSLGQIESPGEGFLAVTPDDLTESQRKGPLNPRLWP